MEKPALVSFAAVSGTSATRRSVPSVSLRMEIFMLFGFGMGQFAAGAACGKVSTSCCMTFLASPKSIEVFGVV